MAGQRVKKCYKAAGFFAVHSKSSSEMKDSPKSTVFASPEEDPPAPCLCLFGVFSLSVQGRAAQSLSRAAKELLALLVLRGETQTTRSWLVGVLWPDAAPDRVLYYLRRTLSELRAALGPDRNRLVSPDTTTLRFDTKGISCDVLDFDCLVKQNTEAALSQAVALYHGALLENHDAEWIGPERFARAERYLAALETLAGLREQGGNLPEAARLWQRSLAADRLREPAYRRLMGIYGRLGDGVGMERLYRELRRHLWDELHVEPTAETTALYQALRARMQTRSTERIEENRLAASLAAAPALPCPLTLLVGRVAEQEKSHAALQTARLVTLVGPGGVGKTRLALAVGERERQNYADGARFADLTPAKTDKDVPQAVIAALGLVSEAGVTMQEALRGFFQPRQLLLILDNAEHLADACAALAGELLRACPHLTILCTSRQPLYVPGEIVLPIAPLAVPDATRPHASPAVYAESLSQYDSVSLLLDRVRQAAPAFRLTPRNAPAVAHICRRLDGLPLALELAAARFRSLSASEIAARLDTRFRLLGSGNPALPRHRTLHAALDWSYDLLTGAERRLLRHLCVFRGGWTLEAAEAVCPVEESETVSLLTSLVDKSLVVYETPDEQARYRLLEMTRQYAAERLEAEEQSALEARHAAFFYDMARSADAEAQATYLPQRTLALWQERDNFRSVHAWYQERDADRALWLEFFLYAASIWSLQNADEWISRLQQPMPPTQTSIFIMLIVGSWTLWNGHSACEVLLQNTLALARACDERVLQMHALDLLSTLEEERGNSRRAWEYAEQAIAIAPDNVSAFILARMVGRAALYMAQSGEAEAAVARMRTQLQEGRRSSDWRVVHPTLDILGQILLQQGEYAEAWAYWNECVPLAEQFQPQSLPNLWRQLAQTARRQNNNAETWRCLEQALAVSQQLKALDREGWTRWDMAELAFQQGDRAGAQAHLRECFTVFEANFEPRSLTLCLIKMAKFCAAWEQYARAATLLGSVERAFEEKNFATSSHHQELRVSLAEDVCRAIGAEAWQAAWERGRQMPLAQAVAYAADHERSS